MLKKLMGLALLCFAVNAKATVINIELDKPSYETNEVISARFIVDNYQDGLAGFLLNLSFLTNQLGFIDVTFGRQFTPFSDVNLTTVVNNNGTLYIDEANLYDNYMDLAALQQGAITLATVRFTALVTGVHNLNIDNAELWDAVTNGNIQNFSTNSANILVKAASNPVSAPASALLLLPALWFMRRRHV